MSYMKNLVIDIAEMFDSGMDSEQIAYTLGCNINHVYDVINFFYSDQKEVIH